LIDAEPGDVEIGRQEGFQRDRRRQLAGADKAAGKLENALMDRFEEVLRLKEIRDTVERLVVDQYSAEQCLFGLDVVRRRAECRFRGSLLACGRIEYWHGRGERSRALWPICGE
jgi:hypothetical protein